MKLTDNCIEEKALEVYQRSIKDSRIDEDICSDIYLTFIKRMKSIRRRYPDTEEVDSAFVTKAVKYIIRDLRKKDRIKNNREELHELIYQGIAGQCEALDYEMYKDDISEKIIKFIQKSLNRSQVLKEYSLWFLLFYSAYFSMDYIQKTLFYLGFDFDEWEGLFIRARELAIQNSARRIENNEHRLSGIYKQILLSHIQIKRAETEEHSGLLYEECHVWHRKQKKVLKTLAMVEIVPLYKDCAAIIGVHAERFRYGVKSFCNKLRHWLGENKKYKKAA